MPKKNPHTFSRKIRMRAGWIPCNRCVSNKFTSGHDCASRPKYHLHELRHTLGTVLASNPNVSLFTIQKMLGHKSIRTTEQFYIGSVTPDQREATKIMEGYYKTNNKKSKLS